MIENIDNLEIIIEIFNGQDDVLIMNTIMETQNEPVFTWFITGIWSSKNFSFVVKT